MTSERKSPNIIVMYADDLGFGDIGCYGATNPNHWSDRGLATPNVDRLAAEGLQFTQGYATAATCTPSRYSLLTGAYAWRNENAHILAGDAPMIIPHDRGTLPSVLKQAGYTTGVVGKWHLGLGEGDLDWNDDIPATPLDIGFDRSFIMAATNDRVPCVYVDGRRVANLDPDDPIQVQYAGENPYPEQPTGRENPELLKMKPSHGHDDAIVNGVSRIGYMRGGEAALWKDEQMAEVFLERALSFVEENRDGPFFLYYAFHQPHVPRLPGKRFAGTTGMGPRGDAIAEMDWCVGQMLDKLEELGLREDTIVVFSSDNGPVLDDGYHDQAEHKRGSHRPAGPLRGGKYSMYDGGTRVPFILSWPGRVGPGTSTALVCHVDFLASFAALTGAEPAPQDGPDSLNMLDALLGRDPDGRDELVTEGIGHKTVLRRGDVVYIPPHEGPRVMREKGIETGNMPEDQLYDLGLDIGQIRNMAQARPEAVQSMRNRLEELLATERTAPAAE